jgi:hypothetical protein
MRCIAGAYTIALKYGVNLQVWWRSNKECKIDFEQLFEPLSLPRIQVSPMKLRQIELFKSRWINLNIPSMIRKFKFNRQIILFSWKQKDIINQYNFAEGQTYIYSCYSMTTHYPLGKIFTPRKSILDRVSALTSCFSATTIGVHIRRTDHIKAMAACSVDDYIAEMDRLAQGDAQMKFYLATDDAAVKQKIVDKFGDRIITQQTRLSRSDNEGMVGSVVDLWALAATRQIIGSYGSSYSELAAELGNIEMVLPPKR